MIERANLIGTRKATFSPCERYRYSLRISWFDEEAQVCNTQGDLFFLCLNPSTADENQDDNTLRRVKAYAHRWGFAAVTMLNIFAWRSTDPRGLIGPEDPVGPENTIEFLQEITAGGKIVGGWGNWGANPILAPRARAIMTAIPMHCLRKTNKGQPEHPLYLPKELEPIPFNF